jgi:cilia- and flagella-associated protein 65
MSSVSQQSDGKRMKHNSSAQQLGIELVDCLEWRGWAPGGEYSRQLVIRNVSTRAIKFTYKLPRSKVFSMGFPRTISLMAGMASSIKVVFRPVKMQAYEDEIPIILEHSVLSVRVIAWTPRLSMEVPAQVDLGYCAVKEV